MNTRNMQGYTAIRISSESVFLNYPTFVDSDDGSAVVTPTALPYMASVGDLQKDDIERLEKAGIIIKSGVTIVIPSAPVGQPDTITHGTKNYRVVDWATKEENSNLTVVATCEEISIPGAV
jgi:hypothetical protein